MANIQTYLQRIKSAIYGREVRDSIHDAIDAINTEVIEAHDEIDDFVQGEMDTTLTSTELPAQGKAVGDAIANIRIDVDDTLTQQGEAADAKAVGDAIEDVVIASDTQPTSEFNQIWIDEDGETEYQVPTYSEFSEVKNALNELDGQINGTTSGETRDVTNTAEWIDGYSIISDTGQIMPNEPYSYTYITVSGALRVSGYTRGGQDHAQGLAFVDNNGKWISGDYNAGAPTYDWNYNLEVPSNATTLRISCATWAKSNFTCVLTLGEADGIVSDIIGINNSIGNLSGLETTNKISIVEAINEVIDNQPSAITVDNVLSDSSTNPVQNAIITTNINLLDAAINGGGSSSDNLAPTATWSGDYTSVNAQTGGYYNNSSQYSAAQIDVSGYDRVYGYTRGGMDLTQGMAFVDANNRFLWGDYNAGTSTYDWNYDFEVPSGAKYMRISCATARKSQFTCTGEKTSSGGLVEDVQTLKQNVSVNTADISNIKSAQESFVTVGNIGAFSWKDGYRVSIYGNDVVANGYSYAIIDTKVLQGCELSGYTRVNNDYPAFVFFDDNNRIIGTDFNPSASNYDYNYNLSVPSGASYVKVSCSIARKSDFTIKTSVPTLFNTVRNVEGIVPQNYRASESVQALKGYRADFDALSTTRLQDVYNWYDNLVSAFPTRLVRTQIGSSTTPEGTYATRDSNTYPIYAYVWTGKSSKAGNKFIIAGGLHGPVDTGGDGIQGVIAMAYFVEDLLFHPDKNEHMRKICDECTIVMIPVLNPWGYQVGYRCNGRGVDCNRNFDYNWTSGTSYGYSCGTEAFSENETAALRDYINANHTDAKFFCEIHTRGGATLPDDARWEIVCNTDGTYTGLLDLLKTTGAEMTECYGGTTGWLTHTSSTAEPTCYSYFDYVMHIPTYEPEFFRSYNMDVKTLDSRWVQIQCVSWMGSMIQTLANHFCQF